jgi:cobalt-zinc-cadmium efflux system outer membrane protein
MRYVFVLCVFFALAPVMWGMEGDSSKVEVTLGGLIEQVLRNNPRLFAAKSLEKSAEARIPQVGAWDDPLAGVEFYATPVTSANPFKDGMETDYFIQQMIPFPGKKGLMSDGARAAARMTGENARRVERDLVAETKGVFAMLYSAQRRIEVNDENRFLIQQIIESARAKYRVGSATQGDVLKVQVEEAKLQNERSVLDQELASAVAMMNALRAAPAATPLGRVEEITPRAMLTELDTLSMRALQTRPEILSMSNEIVMNSADLSAAKKEWYPDIMIKGTYKQMKEQTDQWAAMIGINIPIAPWGIGKYSGRVEENEAKVRASEQSLEEMKNMVISEVRGANAKVRSGWERIERYRDVVLPQADQSYRSTLGSYENNETDFLSLLDSFRMLQMMRMEYYMVVEEYMGSLALLERAVGGDLQ